MDNPPVLPSGPAPGDRRPEARFTPDRRFTALAGLGVVVALLAALLTHDNGGRLLAVVAALMLAGYTVADLVFAPRLLVTAHEVVIRSPFTRARLTWAEIDSIEVVSRMRLGVRNAALEIDAGMVLAEFSRRSLGTDPDDALARVLAFRPY